SIQIAAQDRSGVGIEEMLPLLRLDVQPTVANREVQPAIGTDAQPVQIMPEEGDVDPVASRERLPHVRLAVALGVLQQPEIGDASVVDAPLPGQHSGADAGLRLVKAIREDYGLIRLALSLGVKEQANAIMSDLVFLEAV